MPSGLDRSKAVDQGWLASRARNRWLLWKDGLGRLQWFETGRVNLYVHGPANFGKAYQLVCNGFSFTCLITDLRALERALSSIRFKSAHYVFNTDQRLPRLVINLFAKSNGVIVKVGDTSHPKGVEVVASYPDWGERNESAFAEIRDLLKNVLRRRLCPRNAGSNENCGGCQPTADIMPQTEQKASLSTLPISHSLSALSVGPAYDPLKGS